MSKYINYKSILFSASLILLLTGCRIGKEYRRPKLDLPQQFTTSTYDDTTSIANLEWRSFFMDTTLQSLIQKGINNNHDLLIAMKRINIAQQNLKQAKLLQLPEADLLVTANYNHPSKNSLNGISVNEFLGKTHLEDYQAAINISWEADIWGKLRWEKEVALSEYLQTKDAVNAIQTRLVADIAQGYYNLLMLDKQLVIAQRNLALNDTFLTATKLLKDAGNTTLLAVQQADAQRQGTALLIPQLEQAVAIQENAIQLLTGQLPGPIQRYANLNDEKVRDDLSTGLPVAMVGRRPDVQSAELALVQANAQVGVAQTSLYPTFKIDGSAGLESFKASNWFSVPNALFGLIAGSITEPIFHHWQLRAQLNNARTQREQAVIRFRQSVLQAVVEVTNSLVAEQKLKQQQDIASQQTATLDSAVNNAHLLFQSDLANYLEVITAQSSGLQAELNLATIQRSRLSNTVELYRALGGGTK